MTHVIHCTVIIHNFLIEDDSLEDKNSLDSPPPPSPSWCDFDIRAKEVEAALRAKNLGPALRWCEDNASRLRKLESKLEFRVRERAFLEMVRANERDEV